MSPKAFICTTPVEKAEDLDTLAGLLEEMGYEVHSTKDFCHPQGQKIIYESLVGGDEVVVVCKRRLPRDVFEHNFFPDTKYFSYAMEGDPGDLANRINLELILEPALKPAEPAPLQRVLVIGGGVAGVYAALDVAEQGYDVFLVESDPSIGGIMAALDKTFPTMDCSI